MTRPTDEDVSELVARLELEMNRLADAWERSDSFDDEALPMGELLRKAVTAIEALRSPITDKVVAKMAEAHFLHRLGKKWPANSWAVLNDYQKAKERKALRAALKAGGLA